MERAPEALLRLLKVPVSGAAIPGILLTCGRNITSRPRAWHLNEVCVGLAGRDA